MPYFTDLFLTDDWKPIWTPQNNQNTPAFTPTPHDYQERHHPSEKVTLRHSATRTTHTCRRRLVDARLWDAMSRPQQDAALELEHAVTVLSSGLGMRSSSAFRGPRLSEKPSGPKQHHITDHQAQRIQFYIGWTREAERNKISTAAMLDVLVFGHSCRAIDRARRRRTGWTRTNLLDGLSLLLRPPRLAGGRMKRYPKDRGDGTEITCPL